MHPCIYIIENAARPGKVYIGSALLPRARFSFHMKALCQGKHFNRKLQHSYDHHGADCFSIRPLIFCAKKDLLFYEQRAINAYLAASAGYNINPTAGSNAGRIWSAETRARMSAAGKGKPKPASAASRIGLKASPEARARISAALKGKQRTPEHCAAISASKRGRKMSVESRQKMSVIRTGKKQRPETIAKRNATLAVMRANGLWAKTPDKHPITGRFMKSPPVPAGTTTTLTSKVVETKVDEVKETK